jgi:hypothetical protein
MGRSVKYMPKKERVACVAERGRYMSIARQIHDDRIDAQTCVERINRALDEIQRLGVNDYGGYFGINSASHGDLAPVTRDDLKDITHETCASLAASPPKKKEIEICVNEMDIGLEASKLAEVPSPVRSRKAVIPQSPVASTCLHTDASTPQQMTPPVDYSHVGTTSEIREDFERRFSQVPMPRLSIGSSAAGRQSLGNDSSVLVHTARSADASACSPDTSGYKEPALGSARKLRDFFEQQCRKGDSMGKQREIPGKRNLANLL